MTRDYTYLQINELTSIEETNSIITEQLFLNTLPSTNIGVQYSKCRFVPNEELDTFFFVEVLHEWFKKYVFLDEETENYLKTSFNITDISLLEKDKTFVGYFGRDFDGNVFRVVLRSVELDTNIKTKITFTFFYNKTKNKLILLRTRPPYKFNDFDLLLKLKNSFWHTNRKKKIDLNKPIIVTEGIYDSIFFENSVSIGGLVSAQIIPDIFKNSDLIFVLDNGVSSLKHRISVNILKMGYKIFNWTVQFKKFKDFNEYVRFLYRYTPINKEIKEKIHKNEPFLSLYINTDGSIPSKPINPPESFILEAKNILYRLVFKENYVLGNKDIKTFNETFINRNA